MKSRTEMGDRPQHQSNWWPRLRHALVLLIATVGLIGLTSCSLPQVRAEDRLFLDISLDFLDAYELTTEFEGVPVGGLSGWVYDRPRDRLYAVSDDRSNVAPARFYTLKLSVEDREGAIAIQSVNVESVTTLTENGEPYPPGAIDAEGIALSPRQSVFISSEGAADAGIPPFIHEFDLTTGELRRRLRIPDRYIPQEVDGQPQGVQDNAGFEALTICSGGFEANYQEPFRLFVGTESA
ncbi:MAG: esterase-like activity of phytase family protein, partial [Synechococcales cyanobacterium T60_A2020_003]|nr:esterase-like activity of phytase family protein [Synechococcales cyanobacterium T60_A2020_003]